MCFVFELWLDFGQVNSTQFLCADGSLLLASVLEDSAGNVITLGQGSPPYPMYLLPIVEASWTSAA